MRAIFSSHLVEDPAIFEAGVGEERGEGVGIGRKLKGSGNAGVGGTPLAFKAS
jgi:hypothetical protein